MLSPMPESLARQESKKERSMLDELDPNPSLEPVAPMDSIKAYIPSIPPTSASTNQHRRLSAELMTALFMALKEKKGTDEDEDEAEVWQFGEESFRVHATVFNGVIKSDASCLVRPRCARQVSRLILFCREQGLDISIKAGGYGTHGWSVAGKIILDLSLMETVTTALPPMLDPTHRSLREINWPRRHVQGGGASSSSQSVTTTSGSKGKMRDGSNQMYRSGSASASASGSGSGSGSRSMESFKPVHRDDGLFYAGSGKRTLDDAYEGDMGGMEMQNFGSAGNIRRQARGSGESSPVPKMLNTNEQASNGQQDATMSDAQDDDRRASVTSGSSATSGKFFKASGVANMVDGKLDEASKKSMMDALAGPTEYNPDSTAAIQPDFMMQSHQFSQQSACPQDSIFKFPIATVPGPSLNFGTAEVPFGMGDRRWQFGQGLTLSPDGLNSNFNPFQNQGSSSNSSSMAGTPTAPPYTLVTFDAGARAKDIDRVTHVSTHGAYHVPLAAFPVGSAVMMSGGFGFLSRMYGLSMDNLTEVEFVLADGRIVWLGRESLEDGPKNEAGKCYGVEMPDGTKGDMSEEEAKELWWAIRGAGTVLGVATRYRAKAYHVPVVFAGNLIYPFNPLTAPGLIQHVRDCIKGASRNLYTNIILTAGPVSLAGVVIIQMCYIGTQAQGAEYLSAIGSWNEERCLFKDVRERSFIEQQDSVANVLKGGAGRKWYIKSDLVDTLSDEMIWKTCQLFHTVPDGCTWLFELSGGALTDCKTSCLPDSHRQAAYTIAALHQWPVNVPKEDVKCVTTAIDWIDNIIHPESPGGPLPCFLESSHPEAVKGTYGDNFDRLVTIKHKYDPDNFFKHTVWPTGPSERESKNPLMTYAQGRNARSPSQQRKCAMENSKIGMEGVEAIAQMAEQMNQTPRRLVTGRQDSAHNNEALGTLDQAEIARHPEQMENRDGKQLA